MSHEALYRIEIDGNDISTDLDPILLSLTIKQGDGEEADSLEMELDDADGQIELPAVGATVTAAIWWSDEGQAVQFEGTTDEPTSKAKSKADHGGKTGRAGPEAGGKSGGGGAGSKAHAAGSRSKGRTLTLTASSADTNGKLKTHKSAHKDDATFKDVATEWGQKAGLTVKVDDTLGAIVRPYWAMANEHFMHWGVRAARELGATFKIFGSQAVFAPRQGGTSVDGQALEGVTAAWGVNLIDWSISPVTSRPIHKAYKARHYDPKACQHKTVTADPDSGADSDADGEGGGDAEHTERFKSPDADHAKHKAGSNQAQNKRDKGSGDSVTIDGAPAAQAEAPCIVTGIRPGVDGTYLISDVTHSLTRAAGFTTKLTLKQPSGEAGTDSRKTAAKT